MGYVWEICSPTKNICVYFTCGQIGEHICKGEENLEDDEGAETGEEWVSLHLLRSTALAPLTHSARKLHFTDYYDTLNIWKLTLFGYSYISLFKENCMLCWCYDYRSACDLGQTCLNLFQVNSSAGLDLIFAVFILPAIHIQCLFPKHMVNDFC